MRTPLHRMSAAALTALVLLPFSSTHAQLVNFPTNSLCTQGNDWIINATAAGNNRLGHLQSGTYGNANSQWANIGVCDIASFPPANCNYYGFTSNWSTDRAFFGLRFDNANEANAIIAFGDNVDMAPDINRLIFQFDSWIPTESLEIGTMVATGNFGLHTPAPTATLHVNSAFKPLDPGTNSNVRFQNLQRGPGRVLVIDTAGYVYNSRVDLNLFAPNYCATNNFVPKLNSGTYTCSQIYDDGTSVGIANTGPFPFTVTLTNNVQPGPWSSVSSGTLKLRVRGITMSDGYLISSDSRFKKDVTGLEGSLEKLMKMRGVAYNWDQARNPEMEFGNEKQLGFIAQEVEKVFPEMVYTMEDGYKAVNYTALIPVVVEALKEQQATIAKLQDELARVKDIQSGKLDPLSISSTMTIHPNPSDAAVTIAFTGIDPTAQSAVMIFDMNGKWVKTFELSPRNSDKLELTKGTLDPGMYLVSLISNSKELHTQRLIIQQ
ncbi:hypothetical protein D3C87_63430 [compost metagenome]